MIKLKNNKTTLISIYKILEEAVRDEIQQYQIDALQDLYGLDNWGEPNFDEDAVNIDIDKYLGLDYKKTKESKMQKYNYQMKINV